MKRSPAEVYGTTDIGQLRTRNEDSYLVDQQHGVFAVADGMGGHRSGDTASRCAIEALQRACDPQKIGFGAAAALTYQDIVQTVNQSVFQKNAQVGNYDGSGMGTTLVGLALGGPDDQSVLFNVGDSRAYIFRHQELKQLTRDQTLYQDWLDSDRMGPEPQKNIILQAIGLFDEVSADIGLIQLEPNDIFFLCSDGLSSVLSDSNIKRIVAQHFDQSVKMITEHLIEQANLAGGDDNITVVMLKLA